MSYKVLIFIVPCYDYIDVILGECNYFKFYSEVQSSISLLATNLSLPKNDPVVCLCLFVVNIHLHTKRSYFLQNKVLQSLIKVLFSFLKKFGHPVFSSNMSNNYAPEAF